MWQGWGCELGVWKVSGLEQGKLSPVSSELPLAAAAPEFPLGLGEQELLLEIPFSLLWLKTFIAPWKHPLVGVESPWAQTNPCWWRGRRGALSCRHLVPGIIPVLSRRNSWVNLSSSKTCVWSAQLSPAEFLSQAQVQQSFSLWFVVLWDVFWFGADVFGSTLILQRSWEKLNCWESGLDFVSHQVCKTLLMLNPSSLPLKEIS